MAVREDPGAAEAGCRLESVATREELAGLLAERRARADVSLRELEAWANRAGGVRLPRATCSDMLAGRRFPKKALMLTFLRGCHVPEGRLAEWARAWERVKVAEEAAEPGAPRDERGRVARVARVHRMARRGIGLAAGLIVPVLSVTVLIVTALIVTVLIVIAYRQWGRGLAPPPTSTSAAPPPGRTVTDDGRAFGAGGSSRFVVQVDAANTGVRLTRRLDAGIAMQAAFITVNGSGAGRWQPLPGEPAYRWRDQTVEISPRLTAGRRTLTITNTFESSTQDFNEFGYVIEQRVNGVWSRADVVDVGPAHPAAEAAHDYRITGQTYAGVREFDYRN
jgi:hypothetical protein